MDPTLLLLRWAHVLAAIVAMGGLVFARFALLPALSEVDAAARDGVTAEEVDRSAVRMRRVTTSCVGSRQRHLRPCKKGYLGQSFLFTQVS